MGTAQAQIKKRKADQMNRLRLFLSVAWILMLVEVALPAQSGRSIVRLESPINSADPTNRVSAERPGPVSTTARGIRKGVPGASPFERIQASLAQRASTRGVHKISSDQLLPLAKDAPERMVLPIGGAAYIQPQVPIPLSGLLLFYDMYMGADPTVLYDKSISGLNG